MLRTSSFLAVLLHILTYIIIKADDGAGKTGILGGKGKHMVAAGNADLADVLRLQLTCKVAVKGVDDTGITATVSASDAVTYGCNLGVKVACSPCIKAEELKCLVCRSVHITEKLTLGTHNVGLTAATGKG